MEIMERGMAGRDTATHESLLQASRFIRTLAKRPGLKMACPEEVAYRMGPIDVQQLECLAAPLRHGSYGQYLLALLTERIF